MSDQKSNFSWDNKKNEILKKFEQTGIRLKEQERSFWTSLMTIQAALLAISLALAQRLGTDVNFFLKGTWVFLILSIGFGLLVFKCSLAAEASESFKHMQFSLNLTDFNSRYEKGEIKDPEELTGLFSAIILQMDRSDIQKNFNGYAKKLAEKYKDKLLSEKLFKEIEVSKPVKFYKQSLVKLNKNINVLMFLFYSFSIAAFIFLFLSVTLS